VSETTSHATLRSGVELGTATASPDARNAVRVLGTGMTDMSRRDLTPEQMAHQVVAEALADAGLDAGAVWLVVMSNAMGGRLADQGCIRGQSWLRKAGLGDAPVVNVDNSCAGGSSALHLGHLAAQTSDRPVLVVGVEKMWTGDRAATLAGIEDGLPSDYRNDMHARLREEDNPAGSILMGLNARWADQHMTERGTTVEQIAAAAAKAFRHGSANPLAQRQQSVTIDEVLGSPRVAGVLTRLMCSSFTDGAAALVLGGPGVGPATAPRIIGSIARSGNGDMDYHDRLTQTADAAWEAFGVSPQECDIVEIHDATSAEELFALESLGFFAPGAAGPATLAGETTVGGRAMTVNPSGGLVARGHPLGATGLAQVVELATHLRGRAGQRQVEGARLGVAVNTGGVIEGDAAFVGIHALAAGS
jgi:acetyl-CoA acetyltransferase